MSDLFAQHQTDTRADSAEEGWHYARVALERGMDQLGLGTGFTYKSRQPLVVGRRVEVPLGRGNTRSAGIVIQTGGPELADGFALGRIKAITSDTGAGLPSDLVELARWISAYYVCPLGMVLAIMLPSAVKRRTGLRTLSRLLRTDLKIASQLLESVRLTPKVGQAWEAIAAIEDEAFPIDAHELAFRAGLKTKAAITTLTQLGVLRAVDIEDVRAVGGAPLQLTIEQTNTGRAGAPLGPDGLSLARPTLTQSQSRVVDGISDTFKRFGVHLIRGVTGSGKTEVYLRVIERALDAGTTALVLVPEISLTPQISGRFLARFRDAGVAVLHSGLSASQRHKEWARAAAGSARVVVGARSAVFAPLTNIGVIVVDEEHASDYKQDQLPRYHGRDVAIKRGQMAPCPVILGSATPALESWVNALGPLPPLSTQPKYRLWELTDRVGGGAMPRVEIVDMNDERRLRAQTNARSRENERHLHHIGPTLERAIGETLREGGQVILFLNKRGYASYIACPNANCAYVISCDSCDAKMVQHRVIAGGHAPKGMVRCHHCGAQSLIPPRCPVCDKGLIALGLGTQRIEEELARKFGRLLGGEDQFDASTSIDPAAPREWTAPLGMLRIDGDTMGSASDYFDALAKFASGEIRLLLGTQMIAKGLDFPNVRLVGVINADTALSLPDFRASERTFQLVTQVAGRAGRGVQRGRVIVQTLDPSQPAIQFASQHDYVGFATHELATRQSSDLPPITRMARIVLRDESLEAAQEAGRVLAAELQGSIAALAPNTVHMLGPMPCPIDRIGGFHRLCIELTARSRTVLQDILQQARGKGLLKSDAHTAIDIDPIALM